MSTSTPPYFISKDTLDTLDAAFGASGITLTRFNNQQLTPLGLAVAADGSLMLAVDAYDASGGRLLLLRYDSQGRLDSRFGTNGVVTTTFETSGGSAFAMTLDADGRILVAGDFYNGKNLDFALARYLADGSLDTAFATAGMATTGFASSDDRALALTVQADGRIVAVGQTFDAGQDNFGVVRYLANGQLDSSFGNLGKATVDFRKAGDGATAVALQADGKLLVAGHSANGVRGDDFGLVRFNSNGTFDTSFGSGGGVTTDNQSSNDIPWAMAVQTDGKIVLAGRTFTGNSASAMVVRYLANGSLDTSFGTGGIAVSSLMDSASDLILRPDGKLLLSGSAKGDFALVRLNGNGQVDTTFGSNGLVTTSIQSQTDRIAHLWLQTDGKLLALGSSQDGVQTAVALTRYGWDTALPALSEDASGDAGQTVQALYGPIFSDADGNTLAGIAISANRATASEGGWQYSTDGGTQWYEIASVSADAVLLLNRDTRLRFLPARDYFGTPGALDVHLVDDSAGFTFTAGASRSSVGLASSLAQTAISTLSNALSITVTPVNDAPTLTHIDLLTGAVEDQPYTLRYEDLVRSSDVHDVEGDPLVFRVDKLLAGQLTLNGQAVVEGVSTLAAGAALVWSPPAHASGAIAAFNLVAVDSSQAASSAATVSIQVTHVNHAPILTRLDMLPGGVEDQNYTLRYDDVLSRSDARDADGDALAFRIESVATGALSLNGQPVTAGVTLLAADASLVWIPPANANGALVACSVVAVDASGAVSSPALPVRVDVQAVNDAPTLSRVTPLTGALEDTPFTLRYDTLLAATDAADVDNDPLAFRIESLTAGRLLLNGQAVTAGVSRLNPGDSLSWTPPLDASGSMAAFNIVAVDPSGATSAVQTVMIGVTAVNDPPLLTRITPLMGAVENQPYALGYTDLRQASDASDPDGDSLTFRIDTVLAGVLTRNGQTLAAGALIQPGDVLIWQAPAYTSGAVTAFSVEAADPAGALSMTAAPVSIQVAYHDDPPVLSRITPLTGAIEDRAYTLSYPALLTASDAHDPDGDPIVFRITSVLAGSLTLDGKAVTPGSSLLTAGTSLLWTPPANAQGSLSAFTVELVDRQGVGQGSPLPVVVEVTGVDDPPTLTRIQVADALEDQPQILSYAQLLAASDAVDVDGHALAFRVMSLMSGHLTLNGQPVVPGQTRLTAGASLLWQPPTDVSGTLTAFSVQAVDTVHGLSSATAVPVSFRVAPVNDPPVLSLPATALPVYQEGGAALKPWPALNLTDVDTARMASASVKLTGFNALDRLAVSTVGTSITAHYDNQTGILQLSGSAMTGTYQNVLRSLTFATGIDLVKPEQRSLSVSVNDGTDTSQSLSLGLTLQPSILNGSNGADTLIGTAANDVINGLGGDDWLDGRAGADRMLGGRGNDTYVIDNAQDQVIEAAASGKDTVRAGLDWTLNANLENLTLTGNAGLKGAGNALGNILRGNGAANVLSGLNGNDTLVGGKGADTLIGGSGADRFVYENATDSSKAAGVDRIVDFNRNALDRIDLTAIDANTQKAGDQTLTWIGQAGFTARGQLRYVYDSGNGVSVVSADINGDKIADLEIQLAGIKALYTSDFEL